MKTTLHRKGLSLVILLLPCVLAECLWAGEAQLKLGYTYLDEIGNRGVQQPSFNIYEGFSLGLENLRHQFANGTRLTGNFKNLTLNNRNINGRLTRSGKFGLRLTHSKYRRIYSFGGDTFTRREMSAANLWVKPSPYLKLTGGYGLTEKNGESSDFFEPGSLISLKGFDYTHQRYNIGASLLHTGRALDVEFRGSTYDNDLDPADERTSKRYRVTAVYPLQVFRRVTLNGGFQHFVNELSKPNIELSSNTVWGAARAYFNQGYTVKYSFILDRTGSDSDLVATDNLTHFIQATRRWTSKASFTLGYSKSLNDDFDTELDTDGILATGWVKIKNKLTLKGSFGGQFTEVTKGATLTGDQDRTRYKFSADYRHRNASVRAGFERMHRENDDIGSEVTYKRFNSGVTLSDKRYGQIDVAYLLADGLYQNTEDRFDFIDHTITADLMSPAEKRLQVGFGGFYYRSLRDTDVESFSLRLSGRFRINNEWWFEGIYDGRNFDDLTALNSYYTANIVTVNLIKKLNFKEG